MTGIKFPADVQSELDACQKAASERAGVQSLPMSTVLIEIVRLGLPFYKERIGLTSKSATKPSKAPKTAA
jgi:hypothetical protein